MTDTNENHEPAENEPDKILSEESVGKLDPVDTPKQRGSTVSTDKAIDKVDSFVLDSSLLNEENATALTQGSTVLSNREPAGPISIESTETIGKVANSPNKGGGAPLPQTGPLPIGTTLGHFSITSYIGGGGMGSVYEGLDLALDRKVAIKVLPRQRIHDQASVARFLNEAKSAARLNHENIAQVYFCGEERGIPFIAFEYVEGINIRAFVQQHGPISLPQAISFIIQMAGALEHAAHHGVTHRDVKPSNIMITPRGNAKLIDMGLARLLKPSDAELELTQSGVTLGTFDYISPEQARDPREADVRSDIYSLGCTLFYMLSGRPPFPEGTVLQKLLKHQGDDPPDIRTITPEIPLEVSLIIQKMMAKHPKNRFQTPQSLIDTLIKAAELIGLQPTGPGKTNWQLPAIPRYQVLFRHLPWLLSLGLLFLGIFGLRFLSQKNTARLIPPSLPCSEESILTPAGRTINGEPSSTSTPFPQEILSSQGAIAPALIRILSDKDLDKIYATETTPNQSNNQSSTSSLAQDISLSLPAEALPPRLAGGFDILSLSSDAISDERIYPDDSLRTASHGDFLFEKQYGQIGMSWNAREATPNETHSPRADESESDKTSPIYIVDRQGTGPYTYSTLQSAISATQNRSGTGMESTESITIELRFNGPLSVLPTVLTGRKIRMIAPPSYHPVLRFHPDEEMLGSGERMFLLNASDLTIENISLDFNVPSFEVVSSDWSLFEFIKESSLTLNNCTLTISNSTDIELVQPHYSSTTFFQINPQQNEFSGPNPSSSLKRTQLLLNRCYLRGEALVLLCRQHCNARVRIESTLFNVSGGLVNFEETDQRNREGMLDISVKDSVGLFRSPLVFHTQKEGFRPLFPFILTISQSLIRLTNHPLMAAISNYQKNELIDRSDWNITNTIFMDISGYRGHRCYQTPDRYEEEPMKLNRVQLLELYSPESSNKLDRTIPHLLTRDELHTVLFPPLLGSLPEESDRTTLKELEDQLFPPESSSR